MNHKSIVAWVARSIGEGTMNVGCPDASSTVIVIVIVIVIIMLPLGLSAFWQKGM